MRATNDSLERVAQRIRATCVQMAHDAGESHLTGALSVVDLLVTLYHTPDLLRRFGEWPHPDRDRVLFSKGHACHALYATWCTAGMISAEQLAQYARPRGPLPIHPCRHATRRWLECSSGSLGHGLGVGVGMAYGMQLKRTRGRVVVVLSDGECNEGSTWEAAAQAAASQVPVMALVDHNHVQAVARYEDVAGPSSLAERFRGFGWPTKTVCGHDIGLIADAIRSAPRDRPYAIVAKTIAGRGVSFMEDNLEWYYRSPSTTDVRRACHELGSEPLYRS